MQITATSGIAILNIDAFAVMYVRFIAPFLFDFDSLLSHRRDRILSLVGSYGIITAASPSMGNLTLFA
jgi:hypothetical protein